MTSEEPANPRTLPRWTVPFVWTAGLFILYGIAPWALSLIGPRYGWAAGGPSLWNILGLAFTTAGFCVLLWCIALHFRRYAARVPMDSSPRFLLVGGPYKFSRNPQYISDVTILLGWALFYGSLAVFLASLAFAAFLAFVVVPSEERQLLDRFGNEYLQYKKSVPRWVGKPRSLTPGPEGVAEAGPARK